MLLYPLYLCSFGFKFWPGILLLHWIGVLMVASWANQFEAVMRLADWRTIIVMEMFRQVMMRLLVVLWAFYGVVLGGRMVGPLFGAIAGSKSKVPAGNNSPDQGHGESPITTPTQSVWGAIAGSEWEVLDGNHLWDVGDEESPITTPTPTAPGATTSSESKLPAGSHLGDLGDGESPITAPTQAAPDTTPGSELKVPDGNHLPDLKNGELPIATPTETTAAATTGKIYFAAPSSDDVFEIIQLNATTHRFESGPQSTATDLVTYFGMATITGGGHAGGGHTRETQTVTLTGHTMWDERLAVMVTQKAFAIVHGVGGVEDGRVAVMGLEHHRRDCGR